MSPPPRQPARRPRRAPRARGLRNAGRTGSRSRK
jgi:hypothetical protein